mmetsp:Transcript_16151/g.40734  ORF Transcript_16151/g.40734 Transcript_16151/m.40734 type:complete len:230 (-) Transcript_16151:387-1076(-)
MTSPFPTTHSVNTASLQEPPRFCPRTQPYRDAHGGVAPQAWLAAMPPPPLATPSSTYGARTSRSPAWCAAWEPSPCPPPRGTAAARTPAPPPGARAVCPLPAHLPLYPRSRQLPGSSGSWRIAQRRSWAPPASPPCPGRRTPGGGRRGGSGRGGPGGRPGGSLPRGRGGWCSCGGRPTPTLASRPCPRATRRGSAARWRRGRRCRCPGARPPRLCGRRRRPRSRGRARS